MGNAFSFGQVKNYDPNIPTLKLSFKNRLLWGLWFLFDFTFGLNRKPENEGDVIKKYEKEGRSRKIYRTLEARVLEEFKLNYKTEFTNPFPLPEVNPNYLSKKEFRKWRTKINMPIVLRGLIKDSEACQKWSIEWLHNNFGDARIQCIPHKLTSLLGEEVKLEEISVKEFCSREKYRNYYINNHHSFFSSEDFYENCKGKQIDDLRGMRHVITQWFISRSNQTGTSLHCANGDNMFLNVKGRKEWHFIHPSFTPLLSASLSKYGVYAVADVEHSLFNNWESIIERYPHFKYIPVYKVVLEEGDVMLNPPWWWHSVRNLDSFTMGCATRYIAPKTASNIAVFHYCQIVESIKHPIKSIYPQTLYMLLFRGNNKKLLNSIFSKK